jgi:hypothetical protein
MASADSESGAPTQSVKKRTLQLTLDYAPSDPADYSRNRHVPEAELQELFERLLNLRHFSKPGACEPLDGMKDSHASQAIQMANQLVAGLIGWALNHRAWRVAYPVLDPSKAADDDPAQCEEGGRNLTAAGLAIDPVRYRNVIADLLASMHVILPPGTAMELAEALEALNAGETVPLLAVVPTGKRGFPHRLGVLELRAVGWVNFLRSRDDLGLEEAELRVADAYKVTRDRVRSWEYGTSTAKESLNPVRVEVERRGLEAAKCAAEKLRGRGPGEVVKLSIEEHRWYGRYVNGSLEADGQQYHKLWKSKPKKRAP